MSTDNPIDTGAAEPDAWSRQSEATIIAGAFAQSEPAAGATGTGATGAIAADPAGGTSEWSALTSGPALALAAFVFAAAQAFGGFVAVQAASLLPSAADSPANHVQVIAVISMGLAGASGLLGWVAIRRNAAEAGPRWAGFVAGAATVMSILVVLQSALLLMLTMLAPVSPPS